MNIPQFIKPVPELSISSTPQKQEKMIFTIKEAIEKTFGGPRVFDFTPSEEVEASAPDVVKEPQPLTQRALATADTVPSPGHGRQQLDTACPAVLDKKSLQTIPEESERHKLRSAKFEENFEESMPGEAELEESLGVAKMEENHTKAEVKASKFGGLKKVEEKIGALMRKGWFRKL